MASQVEIANRALQMCGVSQRLTTFTENGQAGRAIRACYDNLLRTELKLNLWTFAIKRLSIAAETATPAFGRQYQYQLPADYLRMAPYDPRARQLQNDWLIEGRKVLSDDAGPLNIRYVSWDVDAQSMDPTFAEGLASRIAHAIVEELTQSSAKKEGLASDYLKFISDARRAGSIESGPTQPVVDTWESVRSEGIPRNVWGY